MPVTTRERTGLQVTKKYMPKESYRILQKKVAEFKAACACGQFSMEETIIKIINKSEHIDFTK